jgi:hypothetical protein
VSAEGVGSVETELATEEVCVVGSAPESTSASRSVVGLKVRELKLETRAISRTHLVLTRRGDALKLEALGRRGASLQLASRESLSIALEGDTALRVDLTPAVVDTRASIDFVAASDLGSLSFSSAVLAKLKSWIQRVGVAIEARTDASSTVSISPDEQARSRAVPLADGATLVLVSDVESQTSDVLSTNAVATIVAQIARENERYRVIAHASRQMILASPSAREAALLLADAGKRRASVMIVGPDGSGKSRYAQVYHDYAAPSGALVAVRCSGREEDVDQALFADGIGAFEAARGGTVKLSSLESLSPALQARLLDLLATGLFRPTGGGAPRASQAQLICAAEPRLEEAVAEKKFSRLLFERLAKEVIRIPSLRDRPEDVLELLRRERIRETCAKELFTAAAIRYLLASPVADDMRELLRFVERLRAYSPTSPIDEATCAQLVRGVDPAAAAREEAQETAGEEPIGPWSPPGGGVAFVAARVSPKDVSAPPPPPMMGYARPTTESASAPPPPVSAPQVQAAPVQPALPTLPQDIRAAFAKKRLALFVGSGASLGRDIQGGFPTWGQIGGRMVDLCERYEVLTPPQIKNKRDTFNFPMGLRLMLSELGALKTALDRDYGRAIASLFRPQQVRFGELHEAIAELEADIVLTTNYDQLLEMADGPPSRQAYTWKEASYALSDLRDGRKVLFKVHGSAEDPDSVVLSDADYARASQDEGYQAVLKYLLQEHTFVFVGYGMNDPLDLDLALRDNAKSFGVSTQKHYVLLKGGEGETDRLKRDYNVRVISYADHGDLPALVRSIAKG